MGSFFLFSFAIPQWRPQVVGRGDTRAGWEGWGWFLAAFAGLFTLLFTTFLTHPGGLWDGIYTGLEYWLEPARRRAAAASRAEFYATRPGRRSSGRC